MPVTAEPRGGVESVGTEPSRAVAGLVATEGGEGQQLAATDEGDRLSSLGGGKGVLEFVPIAPENIRELRSLNSVLFPMSYQERYYREVLAYDSLSRLVYFKRRLAGTFSCRLQVFYTTEGTARFECYIMTFGVLAPFRRLKLGSSMLSNIIGFYQGRREVGRISLHVHTTNEIALKFYLKHGFQLVETVPDYYRRLDPPTAYLLRYHFAR